MIARQDIYPALSRYTGGLASNSLSPFPPPQPMCVVDFFAIAPAYVELMFDGEGGGLGAEDPARKAWRNLPPRNFAILQFAAAL